MSWAATDNVRHNGKSYAPGKVIDDITDKEAEALLSAGVVIEDNKTKAAVNKAAAANK